MNFHQYPVLAAPLTFSKISKLHLISRAKAILCISFLLFLWLNGLESIYAYFKGSQFEAPPVITISFVVLATAYMLIPIFDLWQKYSEMTTSDVDRFNYLIKRNPELVSYREQLNRPVINHDYLYLKEYLGQLEQWEIQRENIELLKLSDSAHSSPGSAV